MNLCSEPVIGYKLDMGNARYFGETLFVTVDHFAKLTRKEPSAILARLQRYDDVTGKWTGELTGGERDGRIWVSTEHIRRTRQNARAVGAMRKWNRNQ